jgi:UDP-GlcNAc:undecaprenyl-phosphate GlcNAc-1-phosphate transferase
MRLDFSPALNILEIAVSGLAAAVIFSLLAIRISNRVGLLDVPGAAAHKQHSRPTPLAGGIALALSALVIMTIFGLWKSPFPALLAAAAIIFVFGLWDDARGLSAPQKFAGQILASSILIASGTYVRFLTALEIPFLSPGLILILHWVITILWLAGISNSINLIDSMDGQALGLSTIAFASFLGMSLVSHQYDLARFCAVFLGISIGLLFYNITPARLFLGDSGAQTLGFILAAVAIIYTPEEFPQASSWFVPILVLGVPIFDTTLVVFSRLHDHRPIFKADRCHIHHRLVALGLAPGRAVLVVHGVALAVSFLAFLALYLVPWQANLVFGLVVAVGIGLLVFLVPKPQLRDGGNG